MKTHEHLNDVTADAFHEKVRVLSQTFPVVWTDDRPAIIIGASIWQAACVLLESKALDHLEKNDGT